MSWGKVGKRRRGVVGMRSWEGGEIRGVVKEEEFRVRNIVEGKWGEVKKR